MKWLTVIEQESIQHGYVDGDDVVIIGTGDLSKVVAGETQPETEHRRIKLAEANILAPLLNPGKVIAVAANYQSHVTESGSKERDVKTATPRLFLKPDTSIVGPDAEVELNPITTQLDWEVELAVIIGTGGRNISESDALNHVFGYATSNDISARNIELGMERDDSPHTGFFDWLEGKWLDGSAPIGPYIVTADEVGDPQNLALTLTVNGVVKQHGNTAEMIHSAAELISFSSRLMTLNPGDIILTGTPAGVGATTGDFLQPGDVMITEVEKLGALNTHIVSPT